MSNKNKEIGKRIIDAFLDAGWSRTGIKSRIASELKVAPPSVSRWVNGTAIPTVDKMYLISKITKKSADWILYGSYTNNIDNNKCFLKLSKNNRDINIISDVQAGELTDVFSQDNAEKISISNEWLSNDVDYYALHVRGDSMYNTSHQKSLSDGEIVIIDPTKTPVIGDVVVAITSDNTATIKLLSGDSTYKILKPLNKNYENITEMNIKHSECKIIGVAIMSVYPPKKL